MKYTKADIYNYMPQENKRAPNFENAEKYYLKSIILRP